MIGGPSIEQPYFNPYQYAAPVYAQPPVYNQQPQAVRPAQPQIVPPTQQAAIPRMPPPPVVRGQMPDEAVTRPAPRKPPLEMPAPEALGVPVPPPPPDWTDLRVRLDRLGATHFSLEKAADGYHFTCQLPSANGTTRTVTAQGATEADAVQRALATVGR
jgi:hypothetical protein